VNEKIKKHTTKIQTQSFKRNNQKSLEIKFWKNLKKKQNNSLKKLLQKN
jgi:hypothetical protein